MDGKATILSVAFALAAMLGVCTLSEAGILDIGISPTSITLNGVAEVTLSASDWEGTVELVVSYSGAGRVALYKEVECTTPLATTTWAVESVPEEVYAKGTTGSDGVGDISFEAKGYNQQQQLVITSQTGTLTVVTGALEV